MQLFWVIFLVYLMNCFVSIACFEPITTFGVIAGGSAALTALGFNYDTIKVNTYCRWYECCTPDYIPGNIKQLQEELEKTIFGQHIAVDVVTKALNYHYSNLEKSSKPLVMSFQGTSGIGKTSITNVMKKAIYKKGIDSKFVHKYNGRDSFTLLGHENKYKNELLKTIRDAVQDCPLSLFVFDEVDKMPSGILEGITSALDHGQSNSNIDFRKAVFVFISNAGGLEISQHLAALMRRGESREDTQLHHFEKLTEISMYNSNGALEKSGTIENALIDHFIPFLPLEQRHVKKCIEQEFHRIGIALPTKEQINEVLNSVTYEKENEFFAVHGCKKLEKKVGLLSMNI